MNSLIQAARRMLYENWYLTDEGGIAMLSCLDQISMEIETRQGFKWGETDVFGDPLPRATLDGNGVLTVPIKGTIDKDVNNVFKTFGFTDVDEIAANVQAGINNPEVRGILLDVDSPGGSVLGTHEAAKMIQNAARKRGKNKKPVYSVVEKMEASGAIYLAAAANKKFASTSAMVGSVGVFLAVLDCSEWYAKSGIKIEVIRNTQGIYKAAGAFGTALTDEQKANFGAAVDRDFDRFRGHILANRQVPDAAMCGQVFDGEQGVEVGLFDEVGGKEQAYHALLKEIRSGS